MAVVGFSSIASLVATRQLDRASGELTGAYERLSSGMRINRASDDAAGLSISMALNARGRVYTQAIRNGNDGVSALNIADGALDQTFNIMIRLKELATSAANGPYARTQRISLDKEGVALIDEFNRIIASSDFNGLKLLDGTLGNMSIQLGYGDNGLIGFGLGTSLKRNSGLGVYTSTSPITLSGSNSAYDTRAADLNGDGISDLISVEGGGVEVVLSNSNGTFQSAQYSAIGGSPTNVSVALGDINGDGKVDLVVGTTTNAIHIAYGNGNGTFGTTQTLVPSGSHHNIQLGDFNNDGRLDIFSSSLTGATETFLSDGNGNFNTVVTSSTLASATQARSGDFNNDGKLDVLIAAAGSGMLLFGNGDGSFQSGIAIGSYTINGDIGDFNRDGILDLVTRSGSTLTIQIGNGNGSFQSLSTTYAGMGGSQVAVADINNDGISDLSVVSSAGVASTRLGNGDGTFKSALISGTGTTNASRLAIGDFNGDGVSDIASFSSSNSEVSMYLNQAEQVTSMQYVNFTTRTNALESLSIVDLMMARITKERGTIGASLSRIGSALSNLGSARDNIESARSRITDADIASESARLIAKQILQQSAAAVLAQANQGPQLALTLLRS